MKRGQSTLEFAFLIGVVAVAVTAMLVYMKRGFQGNIRSSANQIGAGHYEPGSTTTVAPTSEIKQVFSQIVSKSNTKVVYGTGGSESALMQANRAEQDALREELEILEAARVGSGGDNVLGNQAAIDAADRISGVDTSAIDAAISAADRATTLAAIDDATVDLNEGLDSLETAYSETETARNQLRDADYGCDGMPDSVRRDIARLEAGMADNLVHQTEIRTKITELEQKREEVEETGDAGIGTIDMTPERRAQMLAQVDLQLTALSTQYQPLSNEYVILENKVGKTSADFDRMLTLEREMGVIQGQQTALQAARQRWVSAGNLGTDAQTLDPVVTPTVTPMTLAEIEERIGEINGALTALAALYETYALEWGNRIITPDVTTSTSSNIEKGTSLINKTTSEKLDSL